MNASLVRLSAITTLLLAACACVGCVYQYRVINNSASWSTSGMLDFLAPNFGPPGTRKTFDRRLTLGKGRDLESVGISLARLRPMQLEAEECTSVNLDALKGITSLREITLRSCPNVQNVDGLRGLTRLEWLYLGKCTSLKNLDGLRGLTGLNILTIEGCPSLSDLDVLAGLTSLKHIRFIDCRSLQSVDGIKGLAGLQSVALPGCTKLSSAALRDIRTALPRAEIIHPDVRH